MRDLDSLIDSCDDFLSINNVNNPFSPSFKGAINYNNKHGNHTKFTLEEKGIEQLKKKIKNPNSFNKAVRDGWIDESGEIIPLLYRYNKYGYRECSGNYKSSSIMTLGCSDTFGAGNFYEDTWSYRVSKILNKPVLNCGIPGGSISECLKNLLVMISKVKTDTVMMLVPERTRELYYYYNSDYRYIRKSTMTSGAIIDLEDNPDSLDEQKKQLIEFYKYTFLPDESVYMSFMKNLYAIDNLCKINNIDLIIMPNPVYYGEYYKEYCSERLGRKFKLKPRYTVSRDFLHYGPEFQFDISNFFIERYSQINNLDFKPEKFTAKNAI